MFLIAKKRIGKPRMSNKDRAFGSEAEEADWWAKNQDCIAARFEQAGAAGKLGCGTVARIARERANHTLPPPAIRTPAETAER